MSGEQIPEAIAGYKLRRRLDVAGSAETYQATSPEGNIVVVKVSRDVSPERAANMVVRLEAAPAHPGLIVPFAWGRDGDDFFVVRDYVPGIDLESMLHAGPPLDSPVAVRYVLVAASAVAAIQAQGVVHGNLKTSNLLVDAETDDLKVVGWGLAIADLLPDDESRAPAAAHYLSPEQIQNGLVLPQTDVYALGVILYELVTGVVPFDGVSAPEVAHKHLTERPAPPSKRHAGVPGSVDHVVMRALEKDPAHRHQSAEELRKALAGIL